MESESRSLQSAFLDAQSKRTELDDFHSSSSPDYQATLSSAIAAYSECRQLVDRISLFSPNESLEDIASSELQYLLLDYYLADLTLRRTTELSERKHVLEDGRAYYERFLRLLDSYDILGKSDATLWEQYRENKENFTVVITGDAVARREQKINRFKAEKELKRKLESLTQNPKLLENDDASLRDLRLTQIALSVHDSFQALESIVMELQILAQAPSVPISNAISQEDPRRREAARNDYSERLDTPLAQLLTSKTGPILDKSGRPLRPFTLLDSRQRLQQGVFRPDHNLPTMSIDEYLEEERRRGGIIEGGGEKSGIRPEIDEDDMEKMDEETMKARAWDEFKEENPKGSGNTLNRG